MYGGKIAGNITDDTYIKLINYIHKTCDVIRISLVYPRRRKYNTNKLYMQKIEKYKLFLKENFSHLFRTSRKRKTENYFCKAYYMELSGEVKKYLLTKLDLFAWKIPEDLTFFRDNYCFLSCSSHDAICCILCDSLEEFEVLKKLEIQFSGNFCEVDKEEYQINKMRC